MTCHVCPICTPQVFIFDFSAGRISRHYVNLYQADGFFEVGAECSSLLPCCL